ncbi:MAG TPA: RpiB/LacA/LacB family sugar-phosphate isomerase [Polyangiaceae bacterium]|nr:RpiB/LacA/LacB family sugar-phosphate isomerase [Polyangiaceae bacterium]
MRVALGADDEARLVDVIAEQLRAAGHLVTRYGKAAGDDEAWASTARRVAEAVAAGQYELGVVCCWTGTGVSIAANKVPGVRAALCGDAETARGARKWNDANVLALSLRSTSEQVAKEIMSAWLTEPYAGTEGESLAVLEALDARGLGT